jgi:hypothetical protein
MFSLVRRYRRIMRKVLADAELGAFSDHAMQVASEGLDDLVQTFADKIPDTYGSQVHHVARAAQA